MRTYLSYTLLAAILILLSACESGAKFTVHNTCAYPVYVTVDSGAEVIINANSIRSIDIDTHTQGLFTGTVKRTVPVKIIGETYSLEDKINNLWTDNTSITVEAGQELQAYLKPNRASIKVLNNTDSKIREVWVYKNDGIIPNLYTTISDIEPGESKFKRVDYYTPSNPFFYQLHVFFEGSSEPLIYGDASTILNKDQQFYIEVVNTK